ncbi:MAG: phosphatase PAP2 family protein [Planctomycetota bacterium]
MVEKETRKQHQHRMNPAIWASVIALLLAALLSYFLFDERTLSWFRDHPCTWRRNFLVVAIRGFGNAWIPIWLLFNWVCATGRQRPAKTVFLALLLIFPAVCILKPLVGRPRPREVISAATNPEKVYDKFSHHQSFPSGDAAVAFAVAAALAPFVRRPWAILFFAIAGFVAFMRVAVLAHYPSDVCTGAAIGIISGWWAMRISNKRLSKPPKIDLNHRVAVVAVIVTPVLFGLSKGFDDFLAFLMTYGVLAIGIYLVAKGPDWLKQLRRQNTGSH